MKHKKLPKELFISFVISGERNEELPRIQKMLEDTLGKGSSVCVSENTESYEAIYKVITPGDLDDSQNWEEFFKKLVRVFVRFEEHLPHFTKYEDIQQ